MSAYIQIISVGTLSSEPSIAFVTENGRFLVNLPEGSQRLCIESRIRLGKVRALIATDVSTTSCGGFPGICLTLTDAGARRVSIVSTNGVHAFLQNTASFMRFSKDIFLLENTQKSTVFLYDDLMVETIDLSYGRNTGDAHECKPSICCFIFETKAIKGKFDVAKAEKLNIPKGPMYGKLKNGITVTLNDGTVILPEDVLGIQELSRYCLVVCNMSPMTADSLVKQLMNHKQIQRLQSGMLLQDRLDYIVHFSEYAIVSSASYLAFMRSFSCDVQHITLGKGCCQAMTSFLTATKYCNKLNVLCPELFPCLDLHSFSPTVDHSGIGCLFQGMKVSLAAPNMKFTMLPTNKRNILPSSDFVNTLDFEFNFEIQNFRKEVECSELNIILAEANTARMTSFALKVPNDLADNRNHNALMTLSNALYFLGTGCAIPSKYRNVSAILLHIKATQSMVLLDAGEGTWGQMITLVASSPQSFCGENKLSIPLPDCCGQILAEQLKIVWISHPHADHHLGLIRIISERWYTLSANSHSSTAPSPLIVIAPSNVLKFLLDYSRSIDSCLASMYVPISCRQLDPFDTNDSNDIYWASLSQSNTSIEEPLQEFEPEEYQSSVVNSFVIAKRCNLITEEVKQAARSNLEVAESVFAQVGIQKPVNIQVSHCHQSYGVCIEGLLPSTDDESQSKELVTFKLIYSGDTRPCDRLIALGKNATILIHEATFEDCLHAEALTKRHSTVSEALKVAHQMNAYRVILTHFSQRYPGIPPLDQLLVNEPADTLNNSNNVDNLQEVLGRMVFAFDFMTLSFASLLWAPHYVKALMIAFPPSVANEKDEEDLNEHKLNEKDADTTSSLKIHTKNKQKLAKEDRYLNKVDAFSPKKKQKS